MTFDDQLARLRELYPDAVHQPIGNGANVIDIPRVELPSGWSKDATAIHFVAPVGFPLSKPDCFWTDHDLRLKSGAMPKSARPNPLPGHPGNSYLWFSWHAQNWNPNRDSLLTYLRGVILKRLRTPE